MAVMTNSRSVVFLAFAWLLLVDSLAVEAQTVHCEIDIYVLTYGAEGTCKVERPQDGAYTREPGSKGHYWPEGELSIYIEGGPSESFPLSGHVFQRSSRWTEVFQLDRAPSTDGDHIVLRAGGTWMKVDEWKESAVGKATLVIPMKFAPATATDVRILEFALDGLQSATTWDRYDDRNCANDSPGQKSLFCALGDAVRKHMGRFHNAQPALDIVRGVISERWRDRFSGHMLMNFNNHPATTMAEIRDLFAIAIARAKAEASTKQ